MKKSKDACVIARRPMCALIFCFLPIIVTARPLWAWDPGQREQEERRFAQTERLVRVGCGDNRNRSLARLAVSGDALARIDGKLAAISQEISRRRQIINGPPPKSTLEIARENLNIKQNEFTTASMYRRYPTVNFPRARDDLRIARAQVESLESAGRLPASVAEGGADAAIDELNEWVSYSDRYERLRGQADQCESKARGFSGEPVDPAYGPSMTSGFTIGQSAGGGGGAGSPGGSGGTAR